MMTALSSVIVSFSTVFFSKDIKWLLSSPIKTGSVFSFKALSSSFYASWMVLAVMLPFLLALGAVKNAGVSFYFLSVLFSVPFFASAGFLGTSFSLLIMRFFPAAKVRNIVFVTGAVFLTALFVVLRLAQPEKLISSEGFELLAQYLGYLDAPTAKFLPSWWYTAAVFGLISKKISQIVINASLLFGSAALMWAVLKFLAKKFFTDALNDGQAFAASKIRKRSFMKRSPLFAIFQKDIKVFFRDSNQWTQILILASVILLYLFSMYKLSFETLKMHNVMSVVNCALVCFVSSAVALRLSFPLISLEGESFWFLLTSPVSRFKIFMEKIIFGTIPVLVTAVVLIFTTNYMMGISKPVFIITTIATVSVSLIVSFSAVSIGTVLPKFSYSNIPQIESSLGGIVFILFSFFVIILNVIILARPVKLFYSGGLTDAVFMKYSLFMVLLNILLFAVITFIGYAALKRIEK